MERLICGIELAVIIIIEKGFGSEVSSIGRFLTTGW